jgi:glycosyltransferase involved in cell wall biosynthesis
MWKAWKHQDHLVRTAPLLKKSKLIMAGDGIERRYMTSVDKCPPEFQGVWKAAEDSGNFLYKGLIVPDRLFKIYQRSRVMIDMSYSDTFNTLGNHFNRSIIEGYNNGVVPICVDMNMDETGMPRKMFKPGVTHIEVSSDITVKALAKVMDEVAHMSAAEADRMIAAGRKVLLKYFDYRKCSLEFLKLAKQEPCGVYGELEMGKSNKIIRMAAKMKLEKAPQPTIKATVARMLREHRAKKEANGKTA